MVGGSAIALLAGWVRGDELRSEEISDKRLDLAKRVLDTSAALREWRGYIVSTEEGCGPPRACFCGALFLFLF